MDCLDHLPCCRKSECEASATKQLLAFSSPSYPKDYGDTGCLNVATFQKIREKCQPVQKKEPLILTAEKLNRDLHVDEPEILTMADIYERLGVKENNGNVVCDFCSWQLCPTIHAETVKYGIADAGRLIMKPQIRKINPTNRNINSANDKLHGTRVSNSPSKLKKCPSSRLDSQRPSSVTSRPSSSSARRDELGAWQEPPPPMPIHYSFKYLKHPRQYSDQYRETYTYSKLKERGFSRSSFITGVIVPRARLRCANGREGRGKAIINEKNLPSSTPVCCNPHQDKSAAIAWQLNQQLLESCDVELSVNNPSPTEIAMLSKIPHIHRSTPSIPSNTNGKYGGKGTDKPYPFQLNISAGAQTVIAPSAKKVGHSVYIH